MSFHPCCIPLTCIPCVPALRLPATCAHAGFLLLPGFSSAGEVQRLRERAGQLVAAFQPGSLQAPSFGFEATQLVDGEGRVSVVWACRWVGAVHASSLSMLFWWLGRAW